MEGVEPEVEGVRDDRGDDQCDGTNDSVVGLVALMRRDCHRYLPARLGNLEAALDDETFRRRPRVSREQVCVASCLGAYRTWATSTVDPLTLVDACQV